MYIPFLFPFLNFFFVQGVINVKHISVRSGNVISGLMNKYIFETQCLLIFDILYFV